MSDLKPTARVVCPGSSVSQSLAGSIRTPLQRLRTPRFMPIIWRPLIYLPAQTVCSLSQKNQHLRQKEKAPNMRIRGHPLAGPVSIGKITFSTIFFKIVFPITVPAWITKSIRTPVFDRVASVPNGSAPVTHQDQGLGRMLPKENSARPWQSVLPQKTVGARPCPPACAISPVVLIGAARSVGQGSPSTEGGNH